MGCIRPDRCERARFASAKSTGATLQASRLRRGTRKPRGCATIDAAFDFEVVKPSDPRYYGDIPTRTLKNQSRSIAIEATNVYKESVRPPKPIADDIEWMQAFLLALNDKHPLRRSETRRLTQAWQDAGRDAAKMLRKHKELNSYRFDSLGRPSARASLIPQGSGLRAFVDVEGPDVLTGKDEFVLDEARQMFIQFLLINSHLRAQLCERPCHRCDDYYLRKTSRQKAYCSRKCATVGSAAFATKRRLEAEHSNKLKVAAEQAERWIRTRTNVDWKHWVSKQPPATKLALTPKFLTRAVNKGELIAPLRNNGMNR